MIGTNGMRRRLPQARRARARGAAAAGARPRRSAARHPPHRHLRHRLSHLRGPAPFPAISARHGARALRRGARGAEAAAPSPGDPVIVIPYLSCGTCVACRRGKTNCCTTLQCLGVHCDGGMAERFVLPEQNLYPAEGLTLDQAAMVEFLAIGAHAVRRSRAARPATARWSSAPARSASARRSSPGSPARRSR